MATYQLPLNRSADHMPGTTFSRIPLNSQAEDLENQGNSSDGPPILIMFAYILGLASIAVVVIAGQFPWFTLGPAIVLLMVVHCRRIEAKYVLKATDRTRQD